MNAPDIERVLTDLDHIRLTKLAEARGSAPLATTVLEPLQSLLIDAHLVPSREIGSDIVTVNSQLRVRLPGDTEPSQIALCYPNDAELAKGFVSVLSPMGLALLGLSAGQTAQWHSPSGQPISARVEAVVFQPEASGDFVT
jgi:regulator of nucleoside diphosphate kinase